MLEQTQHTPNNGQPTDEYLRPYLPDTVRVIRDGAPWLDTVVFTLCYAGFFAALFYRDSFPTALAIIIFWGWQALRGQKPFGFNRFDKKMTTSSTKKKVCGVLTIALFIATLPVIFMDLTHLYIPCIIAVSVTMFLASRFLMGWIYTEPATDHPETATELAKTAYYNAVHTGQETYPSTT